MKKFTARDVCKVIKDKQILIQKKLMKDYYSNTISELVDSGFKYLCEQINNNKYILINEVNKNIIETSGNILIFENIIIAVTDIGVYINKPVELKTKIIELDFTHFVEFNQDIYENICKTIESFTV